MSLVSGRWISAGAALALPLCASGHGGEFLLAKLVLHAGDGARLEVTADYGGNPMIADEREAADAVAHALCLVRPGEGGTSPLGKPRLEKRSQPDPSSPVPVDPLMEGKPHELLTAVWDLPSAGEAVRFQVPESSSHSVILWTTDNLQPAEKPRWVMLVRGEESPPVALPAAAGPVVPRWFLGASSLLLIVAGAARLRHLRPRAAQA